MTLSEESQVADGLIKGGNVLGSLRRKSGLSRLSTECLLDAMFHNQARNGGRL